MNEKLKLKAAGSGVRLWEVARELGVADATLSRMLRTEFTESQRKRFLDAVDAVKGRKEGQDNG